MHPLRAFLLPISDARELRDFTGMIGRMRESDAQIRALDTLARFHISDPITKSWMG